MSDMESLSLLCILYVAVKHLLPCYRVSKGVWSWWWAQTKDFLWAPYGTGSSCWLSWRWMEGNKLLVNCLHVLGTSLAMCLIQGGKYMDCEWCCKLAAGIVLNARLWCEQAILEWMWHVISAETNMRTIERNKLAYAKSDHGTWSLLLLAVRHAVSSTKQTGAIKVDMYRFLSLL